MSMSNRDTSNPTTATTTVPKVVFERTYRATLEEVWDLWTTKEGFESWWGPMDYRVEVYALEPRVGGALHYVMLADSAEQIEVLKKMGRPAAHETRGKFTEMHPRERIAITHVIDFLPGVSAYENTIRVELFPAGDRVRMVVTTDPMHSEEFTKLSNMGFASQLTKLDKRFGATA